METNTRERGQGPKTRKTTPTLKATIVSQKAVALHEYRDRHGSFSSEKSSSSWSTQKNDEVVLFVEIRLLLRDQRKKAWLILRSIDGIDICVDVTPVESDRAAGIAASLYGGRRPQFRAEIIS